MKKVLTIVVIIIVLLTGALLSLPLFFKPVLLKATQSTINQKINAHVDFEDFSLSLFRNFPKATMGLHEIVITGNDEFTNDTLFYAESVRAKLNWKSLFQKASKSIDEIVFEKPQIHLMVNENNINNWEISKAGEVQNVNQVELEPEEDSSFELQIENLEIKDGVVSYVDVPAKMKLQMEGVDFTVSGKLYSTSSLLQTNGRVRDFLLNFDDVDYISNTSLETKTMLTVEYEKKEILIVQNELQVNRLPLELSGNIEFPTDSTFFNLLLKTRESGFENFLALIPATYSDYLKDVQSSGIANATARIKGYYYKEDYPAFLLNVDVREGNVQFKGLPEKIKNISVEAKISKPQGELNLTTINVKKAHAEIKNTPVDFTINLSELMEDIHFDGAFVGAVNFNDLKNALPLDSANVSGAIDANLFVNGNYSAIEDEQYDKVKVNGIVLLDNFIYDSPKLTQSIIIPQGQMEFSPQLVFLSRLNMKVGQSDFKLSGKLSNYLNYFFTDGTITGNLQLNSEFVNFNELLRIQKPLGKITDQNQHQRNTESAADKNGEEEVLAVTIPDNIDFTLQSRINRAVFDRVPVNDIQGLITVKNGRLNLNGLNMKLLEGEMNLAGSYENTAQNFPLFDFDFEISKLDISEAYQKMTSLRNFMPVAGHSTGKINTRISMKGQLSPDHQIIGKSVNGFGRFGTENLQITNSPIFNQLQAILKPEKLRNVRIDDFQGNFTIQNGNIDLKPFSTRIAEQATTVKGTISAENLLDLRLDFKINRDAFGNDIQNILSVIPGNEKIAVVPAGVLINGPVNEPEVKMDLSETRKTVANATKGELQNSLDKIGKGLRKLFEK